MSEAPLSILVIAAIPAMLFTVYVVLGRIAPRLVNTRLWLWLYGHEREQS